MDAPDFGSKDIVAVEGNTYATFAMSVDSPSKSECDRDRDRDREPGQPENNIFV